MKRFTRERENRSGREEVHSIAVKGRHRFSGLKGRAAKAQDEVLGKDRRFPVALKGRANAPFQG
jgi:hypothetical protein